MAATAAPRCFRSRGTPILRGRSHGQLLHQAHGHAGVRRRAWCGDARCGQAADFHWPSAARPFSRARWATVFCAAAKLPCMSLAQSVSAAVCMARP